MNCELCLLKRHSTGDTKLPFCLQSCVKPLEYAVAVHEHGTDHVHHYVGKEPSGLKFNMLSLDDGGGHEINTTSVLKIMKYSSTIELTLLTSEAIGELLTLCRWLWFLPYAYWVHEYFWVDTVCPHVV